MTYWNRARNKKAKYARTLIWVHNMHDIEEHTTIVHFDQRKELHLRPSIQLHQLQDSWRESCILDQHSRQTTYRATSNVAKIQDCNPRDNDESNEGESTTWKPHIAHDVSNCEDNNSMDRKQQWSQQTSITPVLQNICHWMSAGDMKAPTRTIYWPHWSAPTRSSKPQTSTTTLRRHSTSVSKPDTPAVPNTAVKLHYQADLTTRHPSYQTCAGQTELHTNSADAPVSRGSFVAISLCQGWPSAQRGVESRYAGK